MVKPCIKEVKDKGKTCRDKSTASRYKEVLNGKGW
jgi:hypothetical protein